MKKIVSSSIILSILLIVLWVFYAWTIGNQTSQNFRILFKDNFTYTNELVDIRLLSFSSTIFGANAQVLIDLNEQNDTLGIFGDSIDKVYANITIQNGPILINKSGIKFAKSAWEITLDEELNESNSLIKEYVNQKPILKIDHLFKDNINYEMQLVLNVSDIFIKGNYDLKTSVNNGVINTEKLEYSSNKFHLKTKPFGIKFKHTGEDNNDSAVLDTLSLNSSVSEFTFQHKNMSNAINFDINVAANSTLKSGIFNSQNIIKYSAINNPAYPIDKGEIKLQVSDLKIINLMDFVNAISEISNLKNQKQWILEEQGELPEGQDKIWHLQDQINQAYKELPNALNKALIKSQNTKTSTDTSSTESNAVFNFSLVNRYNNVQSSLKGELKPLVDFKPDDQSSNLSFFLLTELQAKVKLDDAMVEILASKLPIKNTEFDLVFKHNKLLMQ